MPQDMIDVQTVVARIEKLERQNLRLRRIGMVAVLACGAALIMGQAKEPAPARQPPRMVEGERIVLKDPAGAIKATLLSMPGDACEFRLLGEEGRERAKLRVVPGGDSGLELADKNGFVRASLAVSVDGVGTLELKDKDGNVAFKAPSPGAAAKPAETPAPTTAPAPK